MARPPIIISNKGVFEQLVTYFEDKVSAEKNIKKAIKDLDKKSVNDDNDRPIVRKITSDHKNDPKALWCLNNEDKDVLEKKLKDKWGCIGNVSLSEEI